VLVFESQKIDPQLLALSQVAPQVPGGAPVAVGGAGQPAVLPYTSTTISDPSVNKTSSVTRAEATPEIKAAQQSMGSALDSERAAVNARTGADTAKEAIESQGADREVQIRQDTAEKIRLAREAAQPEIARLVAERKAAREDRDAFKPTSYLEHEHGATFSVGAFARAWYPYGSIVGGSPTAMEIYRGAEAAHR
jgi:hypothetical protein